MQHTLSYATAIEFSVMFSAIIHEIDVYRDAHGDYFLEPKPTSNDDAVKLLERIWDDFIVLDFVELSSGNYIGDERDLITDLEIKPLAADHQFSFQQLNAAVRAARNMGQFRRDHSELAKSAEARAMNSTEFEDRFVVGRENGWATQSEIGEASRKSGREFVLKNYPDGLKGVTKDYASGE